MSTTPPIEVLVKYQSGAYYTQTVQGQRASSTVSAGQAVQRLSRKLWGAEGQTTVVDGQVRTGVELWRMAPVQS